MFQHLPWPFEGGRFPAHLGAVVQRSVLIGECPALVVVHTDDNSWLVGDGVTDPNAPGASVAAHMAHAVRWNSSVAALADLPPGWEANRDGSGHAWQRAPHMWQ
jgi:hypothetical protein